MATNNELKKQLISSQTKNIDPASLGLKALLKTPTMKKKFEEVLQDKANGFIASILTLVNNDSYLAECEAMSILTGALTAATLDLVLDKNLGYAYLVPFNEKNKETDRWEKKATFILGYKGYIQLAQRSGQYKALNVTEVYSGELVSWNRLTEEFIFEPEGKTSDQVIGYVGYFELLNGFKKTVYWTKQEIEAHRQANSKEKEKNKNSRSWSSDYDAMARKTVLRGLLSKWGILSIEMQTAVRVDDRPKSIELDGQLRTDLTVTKEIEQLQEVEQVSEAEKTDQSTLFNNLTEVIV